MRPFERLAALFIVAAVTLSALASCGGPAEDEPVAPTPTAVGTPVGTAVTATIGAAGGQLASADGRLTVVLPAGALAADTVISIQPLTNTAQGGRGQGYALSPDGLTFAQPVELRLTPTAADLDGTALEFVDLVRQDDQGYWEVLDATRDEAAGTVSVRTSHFSRYSPSITLAIDPGDANVEVEAIREFDVWLCAWSVRDDATGEFTTACKKWQSATAAKSLGTWAVNGVGGGNSTVGVATYTGPGTMSYEAPATVPSSNPVKISIDVRDYKGRRAAPLVSTVRITGKDQPYHGTVSWEWGTSYSTGDGAKADATVVFSVADTLSHYVTYTAEGSVTIDYRSPSCQPVTLTLPLDTSTASSGLTVWGPGSVAPNTFNLKLGTQGVNQTLQCSDSNGPFTRPAFIVAQIQCDNISYVDATKLSGSDSTRCTAVTNVSWNLSSQ